MKIFPIIVFVISLVIPFILIIPYSAIMPGLVKFYISPEIQVAFPSSAQLQEYGGDFYKSLFLDVLSVVSVATVLWLANLVLVVHVIRSAQRQSVWFILSCTVLMLTLNGLSGLSALYALTQVAP